MSGCEVNAEMLAALKRALEELDAKVCKQPELMSFSADALSRGAVRQMWAAVKKAKAYSRQSAAERRRQKQET